MEVRKFLKAYIGYTIPPTTFSVNNKPAKQRIDKIYEHLNTKLKGDKTNEVKR